MIRALVGLGNPGPEYALTRHNVGHLILDTLAHAYQFSPWKSRFQGMTAEGMIEGQKIVLLKPLTYMNRSGQSIGALLHFYDWTPDSLCVIHDDLDLVLGDIRVKQGGGPGGHNGLKDTDKHIGADYWRIRVGIDRPSHPAHDVSAYVLAPFAKSEQPLLEDVVEAILHAMPEMIHTPGSAFATRVHDQIRSRRGEPK